MAISYTKIVPIRQLGENYYTHLTTYIDQKSATGIKPDIPGALTMRYMSSKNMH